MCISKCCNLPLVKRFIFCYPLRVGALIVGYLSTIGSVILFIATMFLYAETSDYIRDNMRRTPFGLTRDEVFYAGIVMHVLEIIKLIICFIFMVISMFLVVGTHNCEPCMMKYYCSVGFGAWIAGVVVTILYSFFTGLLYFILQMIVLGIGFYFLVVARSAYLKVAICTILDKQRKNCSTCATRHSIKSHCCPKKPSCCNIGFV